MAGTPLERSAKEAIATYSLKGLLRYLADLPTKTESLAIDSFGDIQRSLENKVGRQLSNAVVLQLGFNQLHWRQKRVDKNTLPLLALGHHDSEEATLENALGTIEIAQRSAPLKIGKRGRAIKDQRVPLFVRAAGVDPDTNGSIPRVIALTYDADNHQLIRASFSLSRTEYEGLKNYISSADPVFSFQEVDLSLSEPYTSAGLITPAMIATTRGVEKLPHVKILHVDVTEVEPQTPYEYGKAKTMANDPFHEATNELGAYDDVVALSIENADWELALDVNPGDGVHYYHVQIPLVLGLSE